MATAMDTEAPGGRPKRERKTVDFFTVDNKEKKAFSIAEVRVLHHGQNVTSDDIHSRYDEGTLALRKATTRSPPSPGTTS
eukprot:3334210-Pyramimonas_sp.AAC.2